MTYEKMAILAEASGFSNWAPLDIRTIELKEEVRAMCADNACGQYGKRWSCPPGCGTLEECTAAIEKFQNVILVQTVGDIEDSFDFETMAEIEKQHKQCFQSMLDAMHQETHQILALGAGCCTHCRSCTYPETPCRFPQKMVSSMEAYGMLVLDICKRNHLQYYYGANRISFTSCFLAI